MDRILALTSKFLFVVGFLVTAGVTISLPWLNSQQVVNFYAASVSYADPINGTMNVNFPFYNLTVIQVSLAAFLLLYYQFGFFFVQFGNW